MTGALKGLVEWQMKVKIYGQDKRPIQAHTMSKAKDQYSAYCPTGECTLTECNSLQLDIGLVRTSVSQENEHLLCNRPARSSAINSTEHLSGPGMLHQLPEQRVKITKTGNRLLLLAKLMPHTFPQTCA